MATSIVPLQAGARRPPRLAFAEISPELYGLDDERCRLIDAYAAYLCEQTGECWTLVDPAKEDSWGFWEGLAKHDQARATYWLLRFEGFNEEGAWCINRRAEYNAANGCPMTLGDVVLIAFMMGDDDEDFRPWRLARRGGVQ